jgi:hypothetical protein
MYNGFIESVLMKKIYLKNGFVANAERIVEKVIEVEQEFDNIF